MLKIIIRKKAQIIWIILCSLLLVLTISLVTLAVMFSGGSSAVSLWGSNLYLVRGESFALIDSPSVVVGERVAPQTLTVGHIVIFTNATGKASIGEIREVGAEVAEIAEGEENLLHFRISDESGSEVIIPETSVLSKAVRVSRFFGIVFNFAMTPGGVFVIAVIPCVCLILSEVFKPLFKQKIAPVNKQDESPTFIKEAKEVKEAVKPIPAVTKVEPIPAVPPAPAESVNFAALKAYKTTMSSAPSPVKSEPPSPELFTAPDKTAEFEKPSAITPTEAKLNALAARQKKKPLSSMKLAEVIANLEKVKEESEGGS